MKIGLQNNINQNEQKNTGIQLYILIWISIGKKS